MNLTHEIKVNGQIRTIRRVNEDGSLILEDYLFSPSGFERLAFHTATSGRIIYTRHNGRIAQRYAWIGI